jgi:hypothetical protein
MGKKDKKRAPSYKQNFAYVRYPRLGDMGGFYDIFYLWNHLLVSSRM